MHQVDINNLKSDGLVIMSSVWGRAPMIKNVEGGAEIRAACRGRQSDAATCFLAEEDYDKVVVIRVGYNSRSSASCKGAGIIWQYADGHGMELVAVVKRGTQFTVCAPGHHGHGPGNRLLYTVAEDGSISCQRQSMAQKLEIE